MGKKWIGKKWIREICSGLQKVWIRKRVDSGIWGLVLGGFNICGFIFEWIELFVDSL